MTSPDPARAVHRAAAEYLGEDEILIAWTLTLDVVGPDDTRYLAHRAGGGADGDASPMAWTALGMLIASADVARDQLRASTTDADDEEDA